MPFERLYVRRMLGGDLSGPVCKLGCLPFAAARASTLLSCCLSVSMWASMDHINVVLLRPVTVRLCPFGADGL